MIPTQNLFIRPWKESDTESFFNLVQDDGFNLFPITIYRQKSLESARQWILREMEIFKKTKLGKFGVWETKTQSLIGMGGLTPWEWDGDNLIDITYRLRQSAWGKGYASELAKALVDYGFNNLSLNKITATITPDNLISKKIVAKLGFKFDKNIILKGIATELHRLLPSSTISSSRKIAIIGNGGGGKTTLAKILAEKLYLPLTHVDSIQYLPGMKVRDVNETTSILNNLADQESWVIDGFGSFEAMKRRFEVADKVIFVDFKLWRHYWWCTKRQIKSLWSTRSELPPGCNEATLTHSIKLFRILWRVHKEIRPKLLELFLLPEIKDKVIYVRTMAEWNNLTKGHAILTDPLPQFPG